MNHIQAYLARGTWGGVEQPEHFSSFEWHTTDTDGVDHYYALPYATSLNEASLNEARRQVAEKCGLSPDDIPIKIV